MTLCVMQEPGAAPCASCTEERDELRADLERVAEERDTARRMVDRALALTKEARADAEAARAEVVALRTALAAGHDALMSAATALMTATGRGPGAGRV